MARLVPLIVLLLLLPAASVLAGDLPQVLQPNTTAYSASEVATVTQAIVTLTKALNDYDMASRRYFSASEWSSRDFAMYTAGVLSGKGYDTEIVSSPGWPDGTHTWVLVGVPLGSKMAWIPVESSPEAGHSQQVLGRVLTTSDTGILSYDTRYVGFSSVVELPTNVPPVAKIRPPVFALVPGELTHLLAAGSNDPDGGIILYRWDFGDGTIKTYTTWVARHTFTEEGAYTVTLTVIDNRGAQSSTHLSVQVVTPGTAAPSTGCGCGK